MNARDLHILRQRIRYEDRLRYVSALGTQKELEEMGRRVSGESQRTGGVDLLIMRQRLQPLGFTSRSIRATGIHLRRSHQAKERSPRAQIRSDQSECEVLEVPPQETRWTDIPRQLGFLFIETVKICADEIRTGERTTNVLKDACASMSRVQMPPAPFFKRPLYHPSIR